jgi:hypothetical protein
MAASTTATPNRVAGSPRIAICSLAGDLHALRVWEALVTRCGVACHLVETDRLAGRPLRWDTAQFEGAVVPALGGAVRVDSLRVVWWRRANRPQLPESFPVNNLTLSPKTW